MSLKPMTHRRWITLGLLALTGLGAAGCDEKIKVSDEDIKQVQYKQLRDLMADEKNPTVVVDPRTKKRYDEGHIEGAINIPLPELKPMEQALADAQTIVVYGTTWTDYTSPAAAKTLMAMGYKNVLDFRGGLELWKSEGGKVVGTPATQKATDAATQTTAPQK
ncbi:MAG: rhodanese-like domain-containing protein [Planctomycetota bacterium]|nr:rhodanese-like domain-containing protein [Planctomycetota bacterium]